MASKGRQNRRVKDIWPFTVHVLDKIRKRFETIGNGTINSYYCERNHGFPSTDSIPLTVNLPPQHPIDPMTVYFSKQTVKLSTNLLSELKYDLTLYI